LFYLTPARKFPRRGFSFSYTKIAPFWRCYWVHRASYRDFPEDFIPGFGLHYAREKLSLTSEDCVQSNFCIKSERCRIKGLTPIIFLNFLSLPILPSVSSESLLPPPPPSLPSCPFRPLRIFLIPYRTFLKVPMSFCLDILRY